MISVFDEVVSSVRLKSSLTMKTEHSSESIYLYLFDDRRFDFDDQYLTG